MRGRKREKVAKNDGHLNGFKIASEERSYLEIVESIHHFFTEGNNLIRMGRNKAAVEHR